MRSGSPRAGFRCTRSFAPSGLGASVIVGGAIALPFVFFLVDYIEFQFLPFGTQASIAMKLAFRLHFLGVVSSVAQLWLDWRKRRNLPFPRIDLRW